MGTNQSSLELSTPSIGGKEKRLPSLWSLHAPPPPGHGLMIEPEYFPAYSEYMKDKSPEAAGRVLEKINPVLDEALRSYGGSEADSVTTRANAKKLALEAIRRYDPARAKLRTHLLSHLRGLRRTVARSTSGVYVPEQWRIDSRHIDAAYHDARDELGREPSDAEIADRSGIPIDRVRKAQAVPGVLASSQFEGSAENTKIDPKAWKMWVESIYHDLQPVDQVILEHSFGLHGKPELPANQIAPMVNLSPGAISQRKTRIQQMLDEYDAFIYGRRR